MKFQATLQWAIQKVVSHISVTWVQLWRVQRGTIFIGLQPLDSRVLMDVAWVGASGVHAAGDGVHWSDSGNWEDTTTHNTGAPTSTDDVTIDTNASISIDTDATAHNLTVFGGHTVTLTTTSTHNLHLSNSLVLSTVGSQQVVHLDSSAGGSITASGNLLVSGTGAASLTLAGITVFNDINDAGGPPLALGIGGTLTISTGGISELAHGSHVWPVDGGKMKGSGSIRIDGELKFEGDSFSVVPTASDSRDFVIIMGYEFETQQNNLLENYKFHGRREFPALRLAA